MAHTMGWGASAAIKSKRDVSGAQVLNVRMLHRVGSLAETRSKEQVETTRKRRLIEEMRPSPGVTIKTGRIR